VHRSLLIALSVAVISFAEGTASAGLPSSARLIYVRGKGAEACPDEAAFRRFVSSRVGYDPFFPWALRTIVAQIDVSVDGFRGRLQLVDEHADLSGEKLIVEQDCSEVAHSLALSASLAIEVSASEEQEAGPPAEPPIPIPEPPTPALVVEDATREPSPVRAAPRARLAPQVWLGGLGVAGSGPAVTAGVVMGAGVHLGRWDLGLEGRYGMPSSESLASRGSSHDLRRRLRRDGT